MLSNKLYELAFAYKKTKLWQQLWDTQVFAIELSGGRIGYVSIMGMAGEHLAVGLYRGEEELASLYRTATVDPNGMPISQYYEYMLQQSCLMCAFEGKDMLTAEEREEAKAYARANNIRISGKNAYPQFQTYRPYHVPWQITEEQQQDDLCEALSASIALAGMLKGKRAYEMGFAEINKNASEIPFLRLQGDGYVMEKMKFPAIKPKAHPKPQFQNDIAAAGLKKIPCEGIWECGIVRFPEPVQNTPDEVPHFPVILFALESEKRLLLPVSPAEYYEENPEELLDPFVGALLEQKMCPAQIKARDERTYAFFEGFCGRMNIKLTLEEDLPALEECEYEFYKNFSPDSPKGFSMGSEEDAASMMAALYMMSQMNDEELEEMPEEIRMAFQKIKNDPEGFGQLQDIFAQMFDPFGMEEPSGRKKSKKRKQPLKKAPSTESYVISVSLGRGCYRHLRISCGATLSELHGAILDAFGFMDDHAHAFFMDNKMWSDWDCYYMRGIEEGARTTDAYRLDEVGLKIGTQFKYVFDFGDEWTFQCKVLRIVQGDTDIPCIIKSKGTPPEQYGKWW